MKIQLQMLSEQSLNEVKLKGDDKKVKYFTGYVLRAVYNLEVKGLPESADHSLFNQYGTARFKLEETHV